MTYTHEATQVGGAAQRWITAIGAPLMVVTAAGQLIVDSAWFATHTHVANPAVLVEVGVLVATIVAATASIWNLRHPPTDATTPRRLYRAEGAIISAAGLALLVGTYVSLAIGGVWDDEHVVANPPTSVFGFASCLIAFVGIVVGILTAIGAFSNRGELRQTA